MKEYEYVEVKYKTKDMLFLCTSEPKEIINEHAEKGYSYAGFIPTEIDAKGCIRKIDLIFEKEN